MAYTYGKAMWPHGLRPSRGLEPQTDLSKEKYKALLEKLDQTADKMRRGGTGFWQTSWGGGGSRS